MPKDNKIERSCINCKNMLIGNVWCPLVKELSKVINKYKVMLDSGAKTEEDVYKVIAKHCKLFMKVDKRW